jgi:Holliday junction resolvase RusA-like endonuclease
MGARPLLQGALTIEIVYHAPVKGLKGDSANIIGGIANTLEAIIYSNDKQLKEIHYLEKEASEERYSVMVRTKR